MKKLLVPFLASVCLITACTESKPAVSETVTEAESTTETAETTEETTKESTEEESSAEETTGTETTKAAVSTKPHIESLSDDLYSFQLQIDEDIYQFPMTYQEFISYGWKYKDDDAKMLDSYYRSSTEVFSMGDLKCYAGFINFDINSKPLNECYIYSIKFDTSMLKNSNAAIILPKGIAIGSTMEEALDAYGTPTRDNTSSSGESRTMTYVLNTYQEVSLGSEYQNVDAVGSISIQNITVPDDFVAGEASDEIPAIVSKYVAPEKMDDEFSSFIINYGDVLYQLPAPVSVFLENGWTAVEDATETTIAGRDAGWVTLLRDNQKLKILARNYSENATAFSNCFVINVKSNPFDNKTPLTIAKGISIGMSQADLESVLSDTEYEKDESSSTFTYYTIKPVGTLIDKYQIAINKESKTITIIEASYEPRYSDFTK